MKTYDERNVESMVCTSLGTDNIHQHITKAVKVD